MLKFQLKKTKLLDILAMPIQTGFQVRGKSQLDAKGNYNLIQVKDTARNALYHIKSKSLDRVAVPERNRKFMNKYLVQKNDVLYLSKLNLSAFLYSDTLENTVPVAHFHILRPKVNRVDPYYLCWILNHKSLKPSIQKYIKGTSLPFISKESLMKLKIPLPPKDTQEKVTKLLKLRAKEQEIQNTIDKKKNLLINAVLNEACFASEYESLFQKSNSNHSVRFSHKTKFSYKNKPTPKVSPTHKANPTHKVSPTHKASLTHKVSPTHKARPTYKASLTHKTNSTPKNRSFQKNHHSCENRNSETFFSNQLNKIT